MTEKLTLNPEQKKRRKRKRNERESDGLNIKNVYGNKRKPKRNEISDNVNLNNKMDETKKEIKSDLENMEILIKQMNTDLRNEILIIKQKASDQQDEIELIKDGVHKNTERLEIVEDTLQQTTKEHLETRNGLQELGKSFNEQRGEIKKLKTQFDGIKLENDNSGGTTTSHRGMDSNIGQQNAVVYISKEMFTPPSYELRYRGESDFRNHPIEIWRNFENKVKQLPISPTEKIQKFESCLRGDALEWLRAIHYQHTELLSLKRFFLEEYQGPTQQ